MNKRELTLRTIFLGISFCLVTSAFTFFAPNWSQVLLLFNTALVEDVSAQQPQLEIDLETSSLLESLRVETIEAEAPTIITHAGGAIDGIIYSNSLEALNYNYARGLRYFEIDFSFTSDDELVLLHDWDALIYRLFNVPNPLETAPLSTAEFMNLEMKHGLTQMAFKDLENWLDLHPDAFIITDTKAPTFAETVATMPIFANSRHADRLIVQVYSPDEIAIAKAFGIKDIIFTTYKSSFTDEETVNAVKDFSLFAFTTPLYYAETYPERLKQVAATGTPVYVHTINEPAKFAELKEMGVFGVYSDSLLQ